MTGKKKWADRMEKFLGEPVDAASPISGPGGTNAQIGQAVGGAVGAVIGGGSKACDSDVPIGQFGWLGIGPDTFVLANSSFSGKPTGDPLAKVAFADVKGLELTETKITIRADIDLADGRHLAFETKRQGTGKANVPVFELLRDRCSPG